MSAVNFGDDFEDRTRRVFHTIHTEQGKDPDVFRRLSSLLSCEYFGLDDDYFVGKNCLDAGCGSNASGIVNLLELGAETVAGCDLDESFMVGARERLSAFEGKFVLRVENVLSMSFDSESFDFVYCGG